MAKQINQYATERLIYTDDDLFDVDATDNAGGDYDSQRTKYSTLKAAILGEFSTVTAGTEGDTLRFTGGAWAANDILYNNGLTVTSTDVGVQADRSGVTGGVTIRLTNTNVSGVQWQITNISPANADLPQNGFSIFDADTLEHRMIFDTLGNVLIGGQDTLTTSQVPGARMDIRGATDTSADFNLIARNNTKVSYFELRNDSRMIYKDGNLGAGKVLTDVAGDGISTWQTPAASGETNTASNQGTGGIGLFDNKDGVDLEFRNVISQNVLLGIALDGANKEVEFTVETNLSNYTNDSGWTTNLGTVTAVAGGTALTSTGGTTPSLSLDNTAVTPGAYTSADITVDAQGRLTAAASGGGGGTPGGANTQVQFNDSAAFGGDADFTYNKTSGLLFLKGSSAVVGDSSFTIQDSASNVIFDHRNNGDLKIGKNAGINSVLAGSIFWGESAGQAYNSAVNRGVFIGHRAGVNNTGDANTFIGTTAGEDNTTGFANMYLGNSAGANATTSNNNVFIGNVAGQGGVPATGISNVAIGSEAFQDFTTAANTVCIGRGAGSNTTTATFNTFVGFGAGKNNLIGNGQNVCVGGNAGGGTGTGDFFQCTFIGTNSGNKISTGDLNTGLGTDTLTALTTGGSNIGIGFSTLSTLLTGSRNVFIGHNIEASGTAANDELNIANIYKGDISGGVSILPEFTVAGVPAAAAALSGGVVNITDETGGYVLAFCDGTNWRRSTDRAIIA